MTQIERIEYMERILNEAAEAITSLQAALNRYQTIKPRIAELEAYYASPQWMRDYDDDRAGILPKDLRRGVLSEDAVFDLLHMQAALKDALKE